jgi:ubiquinone/menaquinone biosynthesis C-methylase UbiE
METRKKIEKNHYDRQVEEIIKKNYTDFNWEQYGSKRYGPILGLPFRFTEEKIKKIIDEKKEKGEIIHFLDYGCGMGVHSIFPAKLGAEVYGIDISEKSLEIAKKWAEQLGVKDRVKFLVMDCEELKFPDNFFDIVFNCGTLSCLDRNRAYPEIVRVLKPDGYFISVDTLGHNPLLNLNRKIKLMRGLRTRHTFENILKMKDIEIAKEYFMETKVYFFNLINLIGIPFQKLPGIDFFARVLEAGDKILLKIPFLRKYAFKVVFIFSQPRK